MFENVNWGVFDPAEKELVDKALAAGHYEHLSAILTDLRPEVVAEIEKIQNAMRPREFVLESEVQKEFEMKLAKGEIELTPEIEAEWQKKIEEEKAMKLKALTGGTEVTVEADGEKVKVSASNELAQVDGLGEKSILKLNAAGIYTAKEFMELPYERKKELLGVLVASKFK